MKLDSALRGVQKLGIDAAPFIYFVESGSQATAALRIIFNRLGAGRLVGVTSAVTITETMVLGFRGANDELNQAYRKLLLESENIQVLPVDVIVAEEAARLRADYNLKTPDALQIATALSAGCEAFLTNDEALRRVGEVRVLVLKELVS